MSVKLVTLPLSVYKAVVAEIIRWNETLKGISPNNYGLQLT